MDEFKPPKHDVCNTNNNGSNNNISTRWLVICYNSDRIGIYVSSFDLSGGRKTGELGQN